MINIEVIDWDKVLRRYRYKRRWSILAETKYILFLLLRFFIQKPYLRPFCSDMEALTVRSLERSDYAVLWGKITGLILEKKEFQIDPGLGFSMVACRRLVRLRQAVKITRNVDGFFHRISSTLRVVFYLEVFEVCSAENPKFLFLFGEMQEVECMLAQLFKAKNVPTVTMQHGLYIDYGDEITVNRTNYENSCSDYFLAWGEETGNLIRRYNPGVEVVLCGAPQIETKALLDGGDMAVCVIMDADINVDENKKLLEISQQLARTLKVKVIVKPHPRNNLTQYRLHDCTIAGADFDYRVVGPFTGHTTTEIIKLAQRGAHVYKLRSDKACNSGIPDAIQFSSTEELLKKVQSDAAYPSWTDQLIYATGEEALCNYQKFFSDLDSKIALNGR